MSIFNYILDETDASTYSGESTILVKNSSSQYQEIPVNAFLSSTSPDIGLITAAVGPVSLTFESGSDCKGINNKAFRNGPGLTSVVFPPSINAIGAQAFSLNPPYSPANPSQGLSSVTFTDIANSGLTTINNSTFYGQSNLTSIILPPSLETIGEQGFAVPSNSGGLTSLTFHDIANSRLNIILDNAFRNTSLTSIILPASLENIGVDTFNISTLNSVTFDDISLSRLENIGLEAFRNATISTITIPNHVKSIGTSAFFGSDGMTVNINSTVVKTLGIAYSDTTFFGATGVTISPDPNTFEYTPGTSDPSTEYTGQTTILVKNSPGKTIPVNAFDGLITTGSVALIFEVGSTTNVIGDNAFKDCLGLKHATIPDSITSISSNAFTGSGLQRVYITKKAAKNLNITVPSQNANFFGATGVTILQYPIVTISTDIIFPYPKNEKNKRLLGVNQKISSGLARPNFKFQTNQFSAGRSRTAQSKQKANGPYTVIFPTS